MRKMFNVLLAYVYVLSLLISPAYARQKLNQDVASPIMSAEAYDLPSVPTGRSLEDILALQPGGVVPNTPPAANGSSFGSSAGIGESLGLGGVIVICIKVGGDCMFGIYDNAGLYVGSVTREQAESDPGRTAGLLGIAEARSEANFQSLLFGDPNAGFGTLAPRVGLTHDLKGDGETVIKGGDSNYYKKGVPTTTSVFKEPAIDYSKFKMNDFKMGMGLSLQATYNDFKENYKPVAAPEEEKDPEDVPKVDSVNWDNVDLTYKKPRPGESTGTLVPSNNVADTADTKIAPADSKAAESVKVDIKADMVNKGASPDEWTDEESYKIDPDTLKHMNKMGGGMTEIPPPTTGILDKATEDTSVDSVVDDLSPVTLGAGFKKIPSGGMTTTEPPALANTPGGEPGDWSDSGSGFRKATDEEFEHLKDLTEQSQSLEKQIEDAEKALAKLPKKTDVDAAGFLKDNIANLKKELERVNKEISRLQRIPGMPQPAPAISLDDLKNVSVAKPNILGENSFKLRPRLNFDTSFTGEDSLRTALNDGLGQTGLNPDAVMILQNGLSRNMINGIATGLNDSLTGRGRCGYNCFILLVGRPGVYRIEIVINLEDLARQKITDLKPNDDVDPNDPLFLHVVKKKKKFLGILGSNVKVGFSAAASSGGGISTGAGVSFGGSGRKKEDIFDQWGLHAIGYTPKEDPNSAWNLVDASKKNVLIALIDSGLDMTHEDKPEFIWKNEGEIPNNNKDDDNNGYVDDVNGWNFVNENNDLRDFTGHGTFVAGIIAANTNNGKGIAGINPGAVIMPIKIAGKEPFGNSFAVYRAIHYAVDNGARIINLSYGGVGKSDLIQLAINYAHARGVFVAIASGNTGEYLPDIVPGSDRGAFTVGAIDSNMKCSQISSQGPNNALLAPGEQIYSLRSITSFSKRAFGKNSLARYYYKGDGTSYSAPMAAATASLMLVANPKLTNVEIEDILMATATDMNEEGWDGETGAGLLNATAAIKGAKQDNYLVYKITRIDINRDKRDKLESVDVYATVRGESLDSFTVEVGKGKRAKKFKKVAGPFKMQAYNDWVARIDKSKIRGSKDWIIRIFVKDKSGNTKTAQTLLNLR